MCVFQVLVGDLPQDFLRIGYSPEQQQISADAQTAQMLQAQQAGFNVFPGNVAGRLSITVAQVRPQTTAKLPEHCNTSCP